MMLITITMVVGEVVAGPPPTPSSTSNMNGAYVYSPTPDAPEGKRFPTNFMSYPGGVESFDAYHGPITSVYSDVWWTTATDSLPAPLVERFDGKVMAIVGIEVSEGCPTRMSSTRYPQF